MERQCTSHYKPISATISYSRPKEKYVDIPQPHAVKKYNNHIGGVDRFDQNKNHFRIRVGVKNVTGQLVHGS